MQTPVEIPSVCVVVIIDRWCVCGSHKNATREGGWRRQSLGTAVRFFLAFFFFWFFFCVACLPACQIRAGCKVVQEGGRVNCRYTRQGLTNLRVNKLRA